MKSRYREEIPDDFDFDDDYVDINAVHKAKTAQEIVREIKIKIGLAIISGVAIIATAIIAIKKLKS